MGLRAHYQAQIGSYWGKVAEDVDKSQKANEQWAAEQQAAKADVAPTPGDNGHDQREGGKLPALLPTGRA